MDFVARIPSLGPEGLQVPWSQGPSYNRTAQAKKSGFSDLSTPRKSSPAYSRSSPALFFFHIMSTVSYLIFYKFWSIMCSPLCYPILTLL